MNIDKMFEEMQIQVYNYRQRNFGKSPRLIVHRGFYNAMRQYMSISIEYPRAEVKLLGCTVDVTNSLKPNEFIIGEKFSVEALD